jgi:tripartite-type tricarboxylate transporter receptor subunit TctC
MMWIKTFAALGALIALVPAIALAQAFPSKPITLICPWPPGGSTDVHLRKFAEIAQKYLGQPVVVDNKPGGGGMIGPSNMAKLAKPDGSFRSPPTACRTSARWTGTRSPISATSSASAATRSAWW